MTPLWMRRFLCWLTGGHRYEDKNIKTFYAPEKRETYITNHCVKCGTQYLYNLDIDRIIQEDLKRRCWLTRVNKRSDTE